MICTNIKHAFNSNKTDEDDGHDHIDSDTPRSGVATPKPDLSDKRLPGIMHSYFGQVGTASSSIHPQFNSAEEAARGAAEPEHNQSQSHGREKSTDAVLASIASSSRDGDPECGLENHLDDRIEDYNEAPPLLPHERVELSSALPREQQSEALLHPYPTPPVSGTPSLHKLKLGDACPDDDSGGGGGGGGGEGEAHCADGVHVACCPIAPSSSSCNRKSISESFPSKSRRASILDPLASVVTTSNVLASHFSKPERYPSTTPPTPPTLSRITSTCAADDNSSLCGQLEKLTVDAAPPRGKSHPSTPTRALSMQTVGLSEQPPPASTEVVSNGQTKRPVIPTSKSIEGNGAMVKAPKGKLIIKIIEARGIRRSHDPYVVAVFQRNELVSKGPRPQADEDEDHARSPTGGIPMMRTGSEQARAMAIPMKSRQSSTTSLSEHRDFKAKSRRSMSNPKWDTEAIFDVVGEDSQVNLSVYDRGGETEEFLGNVDLNPEFSEDVMPMKGWFALKGLKDTKGITPGEIYVEVRFQRTEKKHYGPEDFDILKLIGKGTFGQVYQVRKKDTKRIYAMKVLQKKVIVQKKEVAHTVGERNILVRTAMADSPFIVGLKFSFQTPTDLYFVTDYMSGGELFWHLQKEGRFDEQRAKFYIAELILALQHLHMHDIVYRDLKPENILLDANGHIALCDFGLSKANLTKNATTNTFCGTTEYLAPEVLLDEAGYTKMVDFWSLGVLVFEMCCGWSPFYAEDTQQMYKNIAFGKVRFPRDTLTVEGRNFVKGLLNRNPKHRLGANDDAEELKQHPFFADIDWDALAKKLISPPFKPKLRSETDTSNFDPEFTNALNGASSLNARAAALAAGISSETPLSPGMQANFKGFTYVDESSMEENMRERHKEEGRDDEFDAMDEDDRWDDRDAASGKSRADRMSGVESTGTVGNNNDENGGGLFGGVQFEM